LAGTRFLLKVADVKFVNKHYSFKELTLQKLLEGHPKANEVQRFFPLVSNLSKIDREYALNVCSVGHQHHRARVRWRESQKGTQRSEERNKQRWRGYPNQGWSDPAVQLPTILHRPIKIPQPTPEEVTKPVEDYLIWLIKFSLKFEFKFCHFK
jgi:hypothetical protein